MIKLVTPLLLIFMSYSASASSCSGFSAIKSDPYAKVNGEYIAHEILGQGDACIDSYLDVLSSGEINPYIKNIKGESLVSVALALGRLDLVSNYESFLSEPQKDMYDDLGILKNLKTKGSERAYKGMFVDLILSGYTKSYEYMMENGGSELLEFNDSGYTPLTATIKYGEDDMVAIMVDFYNENGVDLDQGTPEHGVTALHLACALDKPASMMYLIAGGANPFKRDALGRDLLWVSDSFKSSKCKLILNKILSDVKFKK